MLRKNILFSMLAIGSLVTKAGAMDNYGPSEPVGGVAADELKWNKLPNEPLDYPQVPEEIDCSSCGFNFQEFKQRFWLAADVNAVFFKLRDSKFAHCHPETDKELMLWTYEERRKEIQRKRLDCLYVQSLSSPALSTAEYARLAETEKARVRSAELERLVKIEEEREWCLQDIKAREEKQKKLQKEGVDPIQVRRMWQDVEAWRQELKRGQKYQHGYQHGGHWFTGNLNEENN